MAGHTAVPLALALLTWLPWLLQTTGQEVVRQSSVEEIVTKCLRSDVQSLCDPEGILSEEERLEIRRVLKDIERTSFAESKRICATTGQRVNTTVVVLAAAPKLNTSTAESEDDINSLVRGLLPDKSVCRLLAIFVLHPPTLHWILRTGTGSDAPHKVHRRIPNMATGSDERLESIKQSLYDLVDDIPEQPYYLPRGVAGFGKPSDGTVGQPGGWEGDWSTMLYIGAGLGAVILVLAIFVCCVLHQRKRQERMRRAQIEATSGLMIPVSESRVPVVLKAPA